ncbi:MAG: uracil phosphoribosyltransferase [Eubacteriales bacterium]|nr:uracil phosphoribosyltransferase [Eubacteriales bacterium]
MRKVEELPQVRVFDHPLIQHKVTHLRMKETSTKEFRELTSEIAMLMTYEACRSLPLQEIEIETPICKTTGKVLAGKKLALVPILRAGLGMVEGVMNMVPSARVGHIGLYRDPETLEAVEYYCKFPQDISERHVFLLDPMLATGGSILASLEFLKKRNIEQISLLCIIAARPGLEKVVEAHPDVDIYCAALDEELNDHAYIVPGLGDAGDRLFGTK